VILPQLATLAAAAAGLPPEPASVIGIVVGVLACAYSAAILTRSYSQRAALASSTSDSFEVGGPHPPPKASWVTGDNRMRDLEPPPLTALQRDVAQLRRRPDFDDHRAVRLSALGVGAAILVEDFDAGLVVSADVDPVDEPAG